MGIFARGVNREGAVAGMLAGISVTLLYVFQHKGIMFIPGTSFLGGMSPNWFFGIEPNAFGVVGALVNFVVAFGVSRLSAPPPKEVAELLDFLHEPSTLRPKASSGTAN
jgi:cation/acetate symporter